MNNIAEFAIQSNPSVALILKLSFYKSNLMNRSDQKWNVSYVTLLI